MLNGIKGTTARTYETLQQRFIDFCKKFGLLPLPANERTLLLYIAHLETTGINSGSLNVHLSAIKNLHTINGFSNCDTRSGQIRLAMRALTINRPPPKQKCPLTFDKLIELWPVIQSSKDSAVWKAMISLGFYAGLRGAEYAYDTTNKQSMPPTLSNIVFDKDNRLLYYNVPSSKTLVHGFQSVVHCSSHYICAYCCLYEYIAVKNISGNTGPQDYLFSIGGAVVTKYMLNSFIQKCVAALGWDPSRYSAHSLRAGMATTAADKGLPDWQIKKLGNWKSNAYQLYIRDHKAHTINTALLLARGNNN